MPSDLHERLIWEATRKGWRTEPWKPAVQERLRMQPWIEEADEILALLTECPLQPDAWRLTIKRDGPGCDLLLWLEFLEVEVTHRISRDKWQWYSAIWEAFDLTDRLEFNVIVMASDGTTWELNLYPRREGHVA